MLIFREEPFIPYIDSLPSLKRNVDGPFMMPIVDKFADMGTILIGKVESGECVKGQTLSVYPNRVDVKVDQLWSDDIEVTKVVSGENIKVKVKGIEEDAVTPGFVLCDPQNPIKSCKVFDAQVNIQTVLNLSLSLNQPVYLLGCGVRLRKHHMCGENVRPPLASDHRRGHAESLDLPG